MYDCAEGVVLRVCNVKGTRSKKEELAVVTALARKQEKTMHA